jgi:flagellar biogenesis protein FliO
LRTANVPSKLLVVCVTTTTINHLRDHPNKPSMFWRTA